MTKDSRFIPVPEMLFNLHTPFKLSCSFYRGNDIALDNAIPDASCNKYLIQPKASDEDNDDFYGYFTHDHLHYEDPNLNPDAISHVEVSIDVDASIAQDKSPIVVFLDAAFDNLPNNIREYVTNNMYIVPNGQRGRVSFNRHIKKVINSEYKATLGISPTYDEIPYILSNIQTEPIENDKLTNGVLSSIVLLNVQYFFIKIETEQRTRTVFSIFGLVGGAYGIASTIYIILFGTNVIRPWGCVHHSCGLRGRTHNKLRKELTVIPLVQNLGVSSNPQEISRELIALQSRVNSLEVFLREYVVDVKYMEGLKDDVVEGNDIPPVNVSYNQNNNIAPPYDIMIHNR
ncbi:6883_t:CDS:2 [Funneliformis geosporum]|uniref:6883_t:CDS:1 n=1 Tax=Funneliformis geosporum TaxID=1117311 RepID=A0A9W4SSI9_9GLOM|nr:6883_t:CDS:2 [Funneliformis geosporum]